jgi:hypothetical protein
MGDGVRLKEMDVRTKMKVKRASSERRRRRGRRGLKIAGYY